MIRNRHFKSIFVITFAFALIMGLSLDATAQRKSRSKRARLAAQKKAAAKAELRKGAEDVAIQIKNVTKFVFVLGGIATGIEDIDKEIKAGNANREIEAKNAQFKDNVIRSIKALRSGLMKLEVDFRAKPALKPYSRHILGLFLESERAENFAAAGRLNDSGKELLLLVERLADALVELP